MDYRIQLTRTIVRTEFYIIEADSEEEAVHMAENELVLPVTVNDPTYNTPELDIVEEMS